jgi:hypothetical protein
LWLSLPFPWEKRVLNIPLRQEFIQTRLSLGNTNCDACKQSARHLVIIRETNMQVREKVNFSSKIVKDGRAQLYGSGHRKVKRKTEFS